MGVLKSCKPRKEVLQGDLDDAVFAADFGNLIAGNAPKVYAHSKTFFQNTHPARQLCKIIQTVFERVANSKEGGATIRLSTGFGGGKTHTLMALWHLARNISDTSMGTELLPGAGRPENITIVAIDAAKAGVPVFSTHKTTKVRSLYGELFYQLGGVKGLCSLEKDDPEASPEESQIKAIFPKGPVLILLDELVIYMAKLSERGQGNLLGFIRSLSSVVTGRPGLEKTDPPIPMCARLYHAWLDVSMNFIVTLWKDKEIVSETARAFTRWTVKELMPSPPKVMLPRGFDMINIASDLVFEKAMFKLACLTDHARAKEAVSELSQSLDLSDERFHKVFTDLIEMTGRTNVQAKG